MKKVLIIVLILIMTLSLFACTKKEDDESKNIESGEPFSEYVKEDELRSVVGSEASEELIVKNEKSNYLDENINIEQAISDAESDNVVSQDWYINNDLSTETTIEINSNDNIVLEGKYADILPPINNTISFEDMLIECEGRCLYYTLSATPYFSTGIGQKIIVPEEMRQYPVYVLRRADTGVLYDVKKYSHGGYIYSFYDKEFSREEGMYVTDDPTNVHLIGGVYVENVLSYADFSNLHVGDSIDKVEGIDSAVSFYRIFFADKADQTEFFGKYAYEKTNSLHLLTDGLLTIHYELVDNEYIVSDIVFSEDYIYDSPYITETYGHSYLKQFKILPQDYPTAS